VTTTLDKYKEHNWKELPKSVRIAAKFLGYNEQLWENHDNDGGGGDAPPAEGKSWHCLTLPEQQAATELGYTAELWNDDSSSSSSSSDEEDKGGESINNNNNNNANKGGGEEEGDDEDAARTRPNLLCVQLYTETNDYKLQVNDHMGVSMYVNRDMTADEIVFQFPVGPSQQSALLLEASTAESLTPVRQAFADRFLEWQSMYKTQSGRVGTSIVASPLFHLGDFMSNHPHPKTTALSSTTVTEKEHQHSMSTVEYTIELRENDFLIVEFIK